MEVERSDESSVRDGSLEKTFVEGCVRRLKEILDGGNGVEDDSLANGSWLATSMLGA